MANTTVCIRERIKSSEGLWRWTRKNPIPERDTSSAMSGHRRGFGPAVETILEFVKKSPVDLIVMPIKRLDPTIAAHLPESYTAYDIASHTPCPLLTVARKVLYAALCTL